MPTQRGSQWRRRLAAIVLGTAAVLLALEALLQIGHVIVWLGQRPAAASPGDAHRILCLGDSFTWGWGAQDRHRRSYPARLAQRLEQAAPGRFAVINRGHPGFDSGEILRRLRAQLDELHPSHVLLLIGYNDRWTLGAEIVESDLESDVGFRLRCRTLLLLEMIVGGHDTEAFVDGTPAAGVAEAARPAALCGVWHDGSFQLELDGEGRFVLFGVEGRWHADGDRLLLGEGAAAIELRWRRDGEALWIEGDDVPDGRLRLAPGPAAADGLDRARAALAGGRLDDAAAALADCPPSPQRLAITAALAYRTGDRTASDAAIGALRSAAGAEPMLRGDLACALLAAGHEAEGLSVAASHLREQPVHAPLWRALSELAIDDPQWLPQVVEVVDQMLAAPAVDDAFRARVLLERAALRQSCGAAATAVIADAMRASLLVDDFRGLAPYVRYASEETVAAARESLGLSDADSARLERALVDLRRGAAGSALRLARHLHRCAALCREYGAVLVLSLYPRSIELDATILAAAAESGLELIDPQPRFATALRTTAIDELFVPDGHCNDAGYELLGDVVFDHFAGRLVKLQPR